MDRLCRVCIEPPAKFVSVHSKIEKTSRFSFLAFLNRCTGIDTSDNESLSNFICSNCAESLRSFHSFVEKALKSIMIFKDALKRSDTTGRYDKSVIPGIYKCARCKLDFEDREEFRTHCRKHVHEKSLFECKECGQTFTYLRYLQKHALRHVETQYKCTECGRDCKYAPELRKHMMVHTGEKPYECKICCKRFRLKSTLNTHRKVHIDDDTGQIILSRKFDCDVCDKTYTSPQILKEHKKIHSAKSYSCDLCSKEFTFIHSLHRHLAGHSGEKPFSCEQCEQRFTVKASYKAHLAIHDRASHPCTICDKSYSTQKNLLLHIKYQHNVDGTEKRYILKPPTEENKALKCKKCDNIFNGEDKYTQHLENCKDKRRPTESTIVTKRTKTD